MAETRTIAKILNVRDWGQDHEHGPFKDYKLEFTDGTVATWNRKANSDAPKQGEEVFCDLQPSQGSHPPKVKVVKQDKFRPRDTPEDKARMSRYAAQERAGLFLIARALAGERDTLTTEEFFGLVDEFQKDADPASETADRPGEQARTDGNGRSAASGAANGHTAREAAPSDLATLAANSSKPAAVIKAWLASKGVERIGQLDDEGQQAFRAWLS